MKNTKSKALENKKHGIAKRMGRNKVLSYALGLGGNENELERKGITKHGKVRKNIDY